MSADPLALASVREHPDPYRAALARLQAYFPTPALPPSSVLMWIEQLRLYPIEDVTEAVEILGHVGTGGKPLQFAHVQAFVEDVRRTRMQTEMPTLPTPDEVVETAPEEVAAIIRGYWNRVGEERHGLAEARNARESGDTEARVEAARRLAAARIEAQADRDGPRGRPSFPVGPMRTACGAEAGAHAVAVHGVWCCPNCGSPIDEGCIGGAA